MRPRLILGDVQVPVGIVATTCIAIPPRPIADGATVIDAGHNEIILTAFAAEGQWDKGFVWFTRHRDLVRRRHMPSTFRLD